MQSVDRCRHVRPQAGPGTRFQAGHLPDRGHVLAGEPTAEDVHRWHGVPVDSGDVAEARRIGPVAGEDARDGFVDLGEPDRPCSEDVLDREVQPAVTREQRPDMQRLSRVGGGLRCHG
ncbi:MAG: hypothetical protein Q4G30_02795 [Actinomycetaceae bacterium]|nr:hypothetical protein [Actinomycetaceae bacterium]